MLGGNLTVVVFVLVLGNPAARVWVVCRRRCLVWVSVGDGSSTVLQ